MSTLLMSIHWAIIGFFIRRIQPHYFTVDGSRLCPYPGMTDLELDDFEQFAKEIVK